MEKESFLWYKQPAAFDKWTDALPVGNGRMGAMVFGGVQSERIQLNEDSVWSGGFRDRTNPDAFDALPKIRSLLRENKIADAERLARYALTGNPEFQRSYQILADLFIDFHDIPAFTDYERGLCLDEAVAFTRFTAGGYNYSREVIASAPADVIAIKFSTDNPAGLTFDARLVRSRFCEKTGAMGPDAVYLTGINGGADGISFCCAMTGDASGGSMTTMGEYLVFRNVTEATIYITAATSFRSNDSFSDCRKILNKVKINDYGEIRSKHVKDFKDLMDRVSLKIGQNVIRDSAINPAELPTDERLTMVQQGGSDPGLIALYFMFGRYLLIACSRPGTLPANLQGIWCNDFLAPWDSKYTININTQMNYWPAEICNLSECHMPLFEHMRRMHPRGLETAKKMYGARGFVAHHNTDIWGDCAPQDTWIPATYWVLSVAWFCLHIWEHYEYTNDKIFLAENYEIMKDACLFFVDFLIENDNGELVVSPSVSPENVYILPDGSYGTLCEGCTMDAQILRELFIAFTSTCRILDRDHDFSEKISEIQNKLPRTKVGKDGGIMEWLYEYGEAEPGHRHMSHLFGLFPGNEISPENTPDLAEAAKNTLSMRLSHGGGHTGWSRAWIINFQARLGDGNEALFHLNELLRHSTLPNLFDDHPPFQIDGNFGATAAIAHMLVQSTPDTIYLLKALPDEWVEGSVTGLCAKGGVIVDVSWENNTLAEARLLATKDYKGVVVYKDIVKHISLNDGDVYVFNGR